MPISRCNSVGAQLLLGIALVIVTYMMLTPEPPKPEMLDFAQADKLEHLVSFLVLAFLADAGWAESGFTPRKYLPLLGYGIGIELLQYFVPGREVGPWDMIANAGGLAVYGLAVLPLLRRLEIR